MFSLLDKRETQPVTGRKLHETIAGSSYFVQRLKLEKKLQVHNGCVNTICWNDSGTLLLSGSDDRRLIVCNPFNGKVVCSVQSGHRSNIFCARFLPCSLDREVVSCSGSGEIFYTDLDREDTHGMFRFDCHIGTTYKVVVVPNEASTFLSCGDDGTVRFYDLRVKTSCSKPRCTQEIVVNLENSISAMAVDPVIPHQFALGSADGMVRVYDRRMLQAPEMGGNVKSLLCVFQSPKSQKERRHFRITSLNYRQGSHDILVNYSSDYIYLFNTYHTDTTQVFSTQSPLMDSTIATTTTTARTPTVSESSHTSHPEGTNVNDSEDMLGVTSDDGRGLSHLYRPIRRLRLRGDWSDTGPDAQPEEDGQAPSNLIMQRMSDLLTHMLNTRSNAPHLLPRSASADNAPSDLPSQTLDDSPVVGARQDSHSENMSISSEGLVAPELSSQVCSPLQNQNNIDQWQSAENDRKLEIRSVGIGEHKGRMQDSNQQTDESVNNSSEMVLARSHTLCSKCDESEFVAMSSLEELGDKTEYVEPMEMCANDLEPHTVCSGQYQDGDIDVDKLRQKNNNMTDCDSHSSSSEEGNDSLSHSHLGIVGRDGKGNDSRGGLEKKRGGRQNESKWKGSCSCVTGSGSRCLKGKENVCGLPLYAGGKEAQESLDCIRCLDVKTSCGNDMSSPVTVRERKDENSDDNIDVLLVKQTGQLVSDDASASVEEEQRHRMASPLSGCCTASSEDTHLPVLMQSKSTVHAFPVPSPSPSSLVDTPTPTLTEISSFPSSSSDFDSVSISDETRAVAQVNLTCYEGNNSQATLADVSELSSVLSLQMSSSNILSQTRELLSPCRKDYYKADTGLISNVGHGGGQQEVRKPQPHQHRQHEQQQPASPLQQQSQIQQQQQQQYQQSQTQQQRQQQRPSQRNHQQQQHQSQIQEKPHPRETIPSDPDLPSVMVGSGSAQSCQNSSFLQESLMGKEEYDEQEEEFECDTCSVGGVNNDEERNTNCAESSKDGEQLENKNRVDGKTLGCKSKEEEDEDKERQKQVRDDDEIGGASKDEKVKSVVPINFGANDDVGESRVSQAYAGKGKGVGKSSEKNKVDGGAIGGGGCKQKNVLTPADKKESSSRSDNCSGKGNENILDGFPLHVELPSADKNESDQMEDLPSTSRCHDLLHVSSPEGSRRHNLAHSRHGRENNDDDDDDEETRKIRERDDEAKSQAARKIQEMMRRRKRAKEATQLSDLPQPEVLMTYSGHRNCRTMIKESNFYGDGYVIAGSDCGRIFVWERQTGGLTMYLEGDKHVVNCVQPNPYLPIIASSGIDYDIKIWSSLAEECQFDPATAGTIAHRNELMLAQTRDTVTIPPALMLRVLASHLRAGSTAASNQHQTGRDDLSSN